MSTILDALKRVQRDREQARPLDLRESLTAVEAPLRRKRRERSSLLPVLIAVLAVGAAALGYKRLQPLLADDGEDMLELALAAPPPEPGLGTPPPAPEPSGAVSTLPDVFAPAPAQPESLQAERPLVPEPPPEYPVAQAAAPRTARNAPAPSESTDSAPGPAPVASAAPALQPEEPQPVQIDPPPSAREPVGRPATRTYPSLKRRLPARSREVARAERQRTAAPAPARPALKPGAQPEIQRAEADAFPEIRVANVVWHPEPARRRAEVTIEQTRLADAREGDIVKGIEVEKIEPGAVEFKLGSALKTVRIGP